MTTLWLFSSLVSSMKLHLTTPSFQTPFLDADTGEIFREIPISSLPSDIASCSNIVKLAVDASTKELYITDFGCQFVIKVGLLDNSCSQFG